MLIQLSVFSQADFPRQILYDSTVVTVLDSADVALLNYQFIAYDQCIDQTRLQERQIKLLNDADKIQRSQIANFKKNISTMKEIDAEQVEQIEFIEKESKKKDRKIKMLKFSRTLFTAAGVVGGVYLGYVGSKFLPAI